MMIGGSLVALRDTPEKPCWPRWRSLVTAFFGCVLALYVLMADAIRLLPQGQEAVAQGLPTHFNWPLFLISLRLMSAPVTELGWRAATRRSPAIPTESAS